MKQHELLRHVADNIEAGRKHNRGLLFDGRNSVAGSIDGMRFDKPERYSLKPKTVVINGVEVERGVDVEPEKGQEYFEPVINNDELHASYAWNADEYDKQCLSKGLIFLEKEKAIAMAKAMLAFDRI